MQIVRMNVDYKNDNIELKAGMHYVLTAHPGTDGDYMIFIEDSSQELGYNFHFLLKCDGFSSTMFSCISVIQPEARYTGMQARRKAFDTVHVLNRTQKDSLRVKKRPELSDVGGGPIFVYSNDCKTVEVIFKGRTILVANHTRSVFDDDGAVVHMVKFLTGYEPE